MTSVAAVVCAKDERERISNVLRTLVPTLPTLVVDDGSTDGTSLVASREGAVVTRLPQNMGKGQAMRMGAFLTNPIPCVLFVDADLNGLRPDHIRKLVEPVVSGHYGMVVGMRDYGPMNSAVRQMPLISGERCIRRDLLAQLPNEAWSGYGIETWLNHIAHRSGLPVGTALLDGVSIVPKWDKTNVRDGMRGMLRMAGEVAHAHVLAARHDSPQAMTRYGAGSLQTYPAPFPGLYPPGAPYSHPVYTAPSYQLPGQAPAYPYIAQAPLPPTLTAKSSRTDDVYQELVKHLIDAGGPYVKENLWTESEQRKVGKAIGHKIAAPMWAISTVLAYLAFGGTAGAIMSVAGLMSQLRE